MKSFYPHIAARLFNTPLLLHPGKLSAIVAGLSQRLGVTPMPDAYATPTTTSERGEYKIIDRVAVIEVFGALAHRTQLRADSSFIQGYEGVAASFEKAIRDSAVSAIVLNLDSPGGEVAGAFQLAEQIHSARGKKPITAVASDMACSAAYLIASAADSISLTSTALVGSIGVVTCHADISKAMDKEGVAVTFLYAGSHKIDGNPYEPLPPAVAEQIQADVDHYYNLFVATVARNRPAISESAIRATEARTYIGQQAIAAKLADYIETPDQAIVRLTPKGSTSQSRKTSMSTVPEETPDTPNVPAPPLPAPEATRYLDGVTTSRLCLAAGEPGLIPILLAMQVTEDDVKSRVARAAAVRQICAVAKQPELAAGLIANDADETAAKAATWAALVARDEAAPVDTAPPAAISAGLSVDDRCAAEWQRDPALRAEFGTLAIYTSYARAQAAGRINLKSTSQ